MKFPEDFPGQYVKTPSCPRVPYVAEAGIYVITNTLNGEKYVGSSRDLYRRYRSHKINLNKGKHHNIILQNLVNKYGIEVLTFEILERCTEEESRVKEQEMLNSGKYVMNVAKEVGHICTTNDIRVLQYTVEGKFVAEYISIAAAERATNTMGISTALRSDKPCLRKGFQWKAHTEGYPLQIESYLKEKTRETNILQYTLSGKFVREFESVMEAGKLLGVTQLHGVRKCLRGESDRGCGFQWRHYSENYPLQIEDNSHLETKQWGAVLKYDIDGNFIEEFETLMDAAHSVDTERGSLQNFFKENYKTYKGFQWRMKTEDVDTNLNIGKVELPTNQTKKKVLQYALTGEFLKQYDSMYEACKSLGTDMRGVHGQLIKCCKGEIKTAYGFQWREFSEGYESKIPEVEAPTNNTAKKIKVLDLEGHLIMEFSSLTKARKGLIPGKVIPMTTINNIIRGTSRMVLPFTLIVE